MKRLLITILTIAFLALAATAYAQQCGMTTRIGSNLASKATKGPCTVARSTLLGTATLHCGYGAGFAVARYGFTLPSGCGPGVSAHVDATGTPSVGVTSVNGKVQVSVRITGPSETAIVSLVSIRYYCS